MSYIARRTDSKSGRRLMRKREKFMFHCHDSTNKNVIIVDKAVPTALVNYLPTKDEKNRLQYRFKTFKVAIFLQCIASSFASKTLNTGPGCGVTSLQQM